MLKLIEDMAKAIVDHPDQVRVNGVEGERSFIIELRVAKDDLGKVIGKNGRTITAMRIILNATRRKRQSGTCWKSWSRAGHRRSTYVDATHECSLRL
jgi:uncharacterized protein